MNVTSSLQSSPVETILLNEIFTCEQILDQREAELLEDLAYYQGRLLAVKGQQKQSALYREHIQDIQALLSALYISEKVSSEEFCLS